MSPCTARQFSDQMICSKCGLVWDTNDTDPPTCGKLKEFPPNVHDAWFSRDFGRKNGAETLLGLTYAEWLEGIEFYNSKRKGPKVVIQLSNPVDCYMVLAFLRSHGK